MIIPGKFHLPAHFQLETPIFTQRGQENHIERKEIMRDISAENTRPENPKDGSWVPEHYLAAGATRGEKLPRLEI